MLPQINPSASSLVAAAGKGDIIKLLGVTITVKISSVATGGDFALIECTVPPHFRGPPPYYHARTTQVFYLIDGMLAFTLGEETVTANQDATVLIPPRMAHAFWNPTAVPATFLVLLAPGGLERCLGELADLIAAEPVWPPADMDKLAALAASYDLLLPQSSGPQRTQSTKR